MDDERVLKERSRIRAQRLAVARSKGKHTAREWVELCQEFAFKCVKCGSSERIVKDHIVPIYQGGSDGIDNLQPLCVSCNCRKGPDTTNWVNFRREEKEPSA